MGSGSVPDLSADVQCTSGEWWICPHQIPPFQGCCNVDPCASSGSKGGCASGQLRAAELQSVAREPFEDDQYGSNNIDLSELPQVPTSTSASLFTDVLWDVITPYPTSTAAPTIAKPVPTTELASTFMSLPLEFSTSSTNTEGSGISGASPTTAASSSASPTTFRQSGALTTPPVEPYSSALGPTIISPTTLATPTFATSSLGPSTLATSFLTTSAFTSSLVVQSLSQSNSSTPSSTRISALAQESSRPSPYDEKTLATIIICSIIIGVLFILLVLFYVMMGKKRRRQEPEFVIVSHRSSEMSQNEGHLLENTLHQHSSQSHEQSVSSGVGENDSSHELNPQQSAYPEQVHLDGNCDNRPISAGTIPASPPEVTVLDD